MVRSDISPSKNGRDDRPTKVIETAEARLFPLFRGSRQSTLIWATVLIALIGILDWRLAENVPLGFLYLLPMLMLGRVLKPWQTLLVAGLCTYLTEEFDAFAWDVRTGLPRDLLYLIAFSTIGIFVYQVNLNRQVALRQLGEIERQTVARLEAEQQLKALIESSPAAILSTDSGGAILMANDAAHRMFGVPEPLLLGRLLQSYFPAFSNITRRETSQQLFRTMMQSRGHRENGEMFLAEICFSTYETAAGPRLAAMILDSSEEFRSREESSLHQMLAGSRIAVTAVSHEIRNICGAIAAVHKNIDYGHRNIAEKDFEALGNLVAALERIAALELRPYPERVLELDLVTILEDLKIVIAPDLDEHEITFDLYVEPALPMVWADGTHMMQVLLNLTTNSIRALSESTGERTMSINVKLASERVLVEIVDSGGGIADASKLFRPFQEGARNTGLGLYLARAFARSFGGDLHYEAIPEGSCFVIELAPVKESVSIQT